MGKVLKSHHLTWIKSLKASVFTSMSATVIRPLEWCFSGAGVPTLTRTGGAAPENDFHEIEVGWQRYMTLTVDTPLTTQRYGIVQKFTPPDFKIKNFTPSISPYFNSFSGKKHKKWVKMEKFTPLAKILHCRRHWRHGQIPTLDKQSKHKKIRVSR